MPLSRRAFVRSVGAGGAALLAPAWISARGREAGTGAPEQADTQTPAPILRLGSNENPNGPAPAALEAIREAFGEAARYPFDSPAPFAGALAAHLGVGPEHVLLACGSMEVLRMAVEAHAAPDRPLVTAAPSFEDPVELARALGAPVRAVPVDARLRLDLDGMAKQAEGAGLVYLCNPNNPTGTVHGAGAVSEFVADVGRRSPSATVLVDEAYHEYVEAPAHATAIPLALRNPRVVVARTFSKIFGLAGLRLGYAVGHPAALGALRRRRLAYAVNVLAIAAGLASLRLEGHAERERALNRRAREFTRRVFERAGFAVVPSETNFIMVDVRRSVHGFQAACRADGVLVGRPFPPLDTFARISIGTLDEMRVAAGVFTRVLGASSPGDALQG